jgi:sulfite exporter TauE/SafE
MQDHLAAFAALCGPDGAPFGWLLLGAMFVAGLAGSAAHCAAMCGPFVLAQMGARMQRLPAAGLCERARLREALLLPYHAGRIVTYALIGAAAASVGAASRAVATPLLGWLLLAGAALLALQALARLRPGRWTRWRWTRWHGPGWAAAPWRRRLARLDVTRPGGALLLGLALGALPCGFLYAAVAIAAGSGGPAAGALAMTAFGLGTAPMLIVVALAGPRAGPIGSGWVRQAAPVLLLGNAGLLMLMAVGRLVGPVG